MPQGQSQKNRFFEDFQEKSPLRQIPTEKSDLERRTDKVAHFRSQFFLRHAISIMQWNYGPCFF